MIPSSLNIHARMLYVKAFHFIAVVCWFAGIFYLPRLFVYHSISQHESTRGQFRVMERALFRIIMTPAAIATALFGLWLVLLNWSFYQASIWFWIKIGLVVILYGYHFCCGNLLKKFARDENTRSHTFYRWFNEIPILILIAITLLVVVKPF